MRDYIIATDSCCDFDENLIRELDLTVIPCPSTWDRTTFATIPGKCRKATSLHPPKQRGTCPDLCPQCRGL